MKLKQLKVHNFGKLNDCEMSFEDGVNIVYGPNESGKTTLHEFIKGMFYGIARQRGRASRSDLYTRYEPWDNSSYFSGTVRFESGNKDFRITRNFYKNDIKEEFVCETDGERLSVEHGDMDVLLGDVSETVFDNTISIGQMRSRTDESLYQELRNYMTNYEGSGDWALDIQHALKELKNQEKEYNALQRNEKVGQEARKRELQMNINYLQNEIADYEDKTVTTNNELIIHHADKEKLIIAKQEALQNKKQEESLVMTDQNSVVKDDVVATTQNTNNQTRRAGFLVAMLICLGFAVLSGIVWGIRLGKDGVLWAAIGFMVASIVAGILYIRDGRKVQDANEQRVAPVEAVEKADEQVTTIDQNIATYDEKIQAKIENIKLLEGKLSQIKEMHEEKKTQFDNYQMDYWEYTANTGEMDENQVEIDAIQLAMESISRVSVAGTHRMEKEFHQRISDILKEITNGRYDRVVLNANQEIELHSPEKQIPLWTLSKGTIEQVYFALRMAAAELFCNEEMPILLDDVFVMYDEDRLASTLKWLAHNKHQIIIFTCNTREGELADKLQIRAKKIEL